MKQILDLSYTHLPHNLKTCLLYIGMYPEDHDIIKHHLVTQWAAEGFVSGLDGRDAVEIASSYFNELVNRSMIIQLVQHYTWNRERIYYKVHDMVLDLIVSKSTEENFLGVVENSWATTTRKHARRLSPQFDESEIDKSEPPMVSLLHVRSVFIFGRRLRSLNLLELKFLRVLFIYDVDCYDLTPMEKLFQLRYLYIFMTIVHTSSYLDEFAGYGIWRHWR